MSRALNRRSPVVGLLVALLLVLVGTPVLGAPTPTASPARVEVPLPPLTGRETSPPRLVPYVYFYDSIEAYRTEIPWNSPELAWSNVDRSTPPWKPFKERGTLNSLLHAWKLKVLDEQAKGNNFYGSQMSDEDKKEMWDKLLDKFIYGVDSNERGAAFERAYADYFHLKDLGYTLGAKYPDSGFEVDAYVIGQVALEMKSGPLPKDGQPERYAGLMRQVPTLRVIHIFGQRPDSDTLDALDRLHIEYRYWPSFAIRRRHPNMPPPGSLGTPGGGTVSIPIPSGPVGPKSSSGAIPAPAGSLAASGQNVEPSASTDAIAESPSSPEDKAERDEMVTDIARDMGYEDPADAPGAAGDLGGVDFSTLELRYVSDTYRSSLGTGVQYAYKVDAKPGEKVAYGGREAAQLAADSFFTWLVLPASSFTVNLNPDEPDRIIDDRLGKTDAGRVLLEADLQMKKSVGRLIHPDTPLGKSFWGLLHGDQKCMSMRQWIVPRPAVVRESGNELYILQAPLEVKMESEYLATEGVSRGFGCEKQNAADTAYNEEIYRRRILPELEKAVNTAPAYADLRRVYASRIAAEWYRQRSKTKTTAYSGLVDSGDASAWPARVPWSPQGVFARYLKSYRDGEFRVEHRTRQGNYTVTIVYVYGGVDLTNIPRKLISAAQFAREHPRLDSTVHEAAQSPILGDGDALTWFGGTSAELPITSPRSLPGSPLRTPQFWGLAGFPIVLWLALGAFMVRQRRTEVTGR